MSKGAVGLAAVLLVSFMWGRLFDTMMFQPQSGAQLRPEQLGVSGRDVELTTEDGVRIHGFLLPAPASTRAILFLHGNAGNASHRLPNAAELMRTTGCHVLLLDYRGYGLSQGRPTEAGVYADARAGLAWLEREARIPESRIVVFGRSLGGAVAIDLVRNRAIAGLILESTFASAGAVARTHFGPLGEWAARGRFENDKKIGDLRAPLLFFHGDRDEIVAYELGRRLFDAAPEPKQFETLHGAGHNDTVEVGGRVYFERIARFIDEVAPELPGS